QQTKSKEDGGAEGGENEKAMGINERNNTTSGEALALGNEMAGMFVFWMCIRGRYIMLDN
ncbi:hypothetical protein, partial [Clostridioides difficile]|uniref:hypothetical protein n=1 Tax=Clostridioides difficile TaxID=1496 RepID=UPI001A9BBE83